ncbi:thymidine kinase [Peptoniphilus gorbachii]|uniref:Thymidine kinase n=1 Tax=Peptoniphilus gorbachii TaxID=411567 RepID=A0ABS2MKL5_9FIRM|nr:thymidine kinase [Peptoniphilus gorbachii]MBM7550565.1 thymidine kinase [Peptoniphilus gorbachii]MDU1663474.1 thymidine kinase [Peptoniphilus harei]
MHQYKGRMILHTGSMFSGKTSSLEKDLKRFSIANYKVVAFKPMIDKRYSRKEIVTHDKISLEAIEVESSAEILEFAEKNSPEVIGIDEVQFLKDSPDEVEKNLEKILEMGITVVMAGLDMDYMAKPFEIVKEIMPKVDYLNKHHAVCKRCGTDAWVSHRKIKSDKRVELGAVEEYEPLCRSCYREAIHEDKLKENQEKFL